MRWAIAGLGYLAERVRSAIAQGALRALAAVLISKRSPATSSVSFSDPVLISPYRYRCRKSKNAPVNYT